MTCSHDKAIACMVGVRRGGKGERRAREAREDRTREDSSLPFYGLPSRLNKATAPSILFSNSPDLVTRTVIVIKADPSSNET